MLPCVTGAVIMASSYALLVVSFVPCPVPYTDVGGKCLYFHTATNDTWLNMETLCIGLDGHLLKIDDANLFYDIVNHIKAEKPDTTYFWIGGSDAATEGDWRWTDYTKVKMGTPFWGVNSTVYPQIQEPQGGTKENCILPCPVPYTDVGGKCLYFHTATKDTWLNMETLCIGLDGHLLKIDDANLFYDIVHHINAKEPDMVYFWIGGSDAATEGDWRWTDYTKVKMGTPFWGVNSSVYPQIQEPQGGTKENCICMNRNFMFYFHDYSCNHEFAGICEHNES
ncbi:uncharacterized protein LOC135224600 isoform X1 [Macrobrachium nipponense]|uniref:uncharacterized protein LOC135224600 isoform X1 n=1 Tax=Macrobrachium nipponense TaxID=159736 RepID=UPI0030C8A5F5